MGVSRLLVRVGGRKRIWNLVVKDELESGVGGMVNFLE